MDTFFRGHKIIVAEDAVEAFTQEEHEKGLKYLKHVYNAKIIGVGEVMKTSKQI